MCDLLGIGSSGSPNIWPGCCSSAESAFTRACAGRLADVEKDLLPLGEDLASSCITLGAFSFALSSRFRTWKERQHCHTSDIFVAFVLLALGFPAQAQAPLPRWLSQWQQPLR